MSKLDQRAGRRQPQPIGLVAKKIRKVGIPSTSKPPLDAPVWAVNQLQGNHFYSQI